MSKYRLLKDFSQVLMRIEDILGDGVTTNIQLDKLGYHLFGNKYLGTLSSDQFPKYIREKQCFILNTDSSKSSNKNGHWVGFYKLNKRLYFYDSFMRQSYILSKFWVNKKLINANRSDRDQSKKKMIVAVGPLAWIIIFSKWGERAIDIV